MTIAQLIAASSLNRRDAEVLAQFLLGKDRAFLYAHADHSVPTSIQQRFQKLAARRQAGEPMAYITGSKEFCGHQFMVNRHTLIPRPETEELVSHACRWAQDAPYPVHILEVGTGSGCIAISLALTLGQKARIDATDISVPALHLARRNAASLGVTDRIRFLHADLFQNQRLTPTKPYHLIVANLPYLPESFQETLSPEVTRFEPSSALFAGPDGRTLIDRFLDHAGAYLRPEGAIFLECEPSHICALKEKATRLFPDKRVTLLSDLSQKQRFLSIS